MNGLGRVSGALTALAATLLLAGCGNDPDCGSAETITMVKQIAFQRGVGSPLIDKAMEGNRHRWKESPEVHAKVVQAQDDLNTAKDELKKVQAKCSQTYFGAPENPIEANIVKDGCAMSSSNSYGYEPLSAYAEGRPYLQRVEIATRVKKFIDEEQMPLIRRVEAADDALHKAKLDAISDIALRQMQSVATVEKKAQYSVSDIRMTDRNSTTKAVACAASLSVDLPDWGRAAMNVKYTVELTTEGKLYATLYGF